MGGLSLGVAHCCSPCNLSGMGGKEVWGAALAVVAAIISNIGTNVQKASHLEEDKLQEDQKTPYIKRKAWWIGFILTLVASLMDFVALGLASQALVAALGGGSTLLCNVAVASCYNKDQIFFTDVCGVAFIIAGAIYFAFAASAKPKHLDYEDQFLATSFQVYLAVQVVIIIGLPSTIVGSAWHNLRRDVNEYVFSTPRANTELDDLDDWFKASEAGQQVPDAQLGAVPEAAPLPAEHHKMDKFIYASCAAALGGMSILFGSVTSSIVQRDSGGLSESFTAWLFYISLVLMIVCVITQTHLLNRAMELGDTTAVFPVFEAFWISFGVVGGLFFYNTDDVTWADDFRQGAGCSFMLVGCFCLLLHQETLRPLVERVTERVRSASEDVTSRVRRLSENIFVDTTPRHSRSNSRSNDSSLFSIFPVHQEQDAYGATAMTDNNSTTLSKVTTPELLGLQRPVTPTIPDVNTETKEQHRSPLAKPKYLSDESHEIIN